MKVRVTHETTLQELEELIAEAREGLTKEDKPLDSVLYLSLTSEGEIILTDYLNSAKGKGGQ